MADTLLIEHLQSRVVTRIKDDFPQKYKDKFNDLTFTTQEQNVVTVFPTIYIRLMDAPEIGADLDGVDINAVNATFQVIVYDNSTSETNAKSLMNEVVRIMKSMRFQVAKTPFVSGRNPIENIARFRRVVGKDDAL